MSQFARPSGTVDAGGWTPIIAASLHECTDEVTPNGDTDYAEADSTDTIMKLNLSSVDDPEVGTGHIVRISICGYNPGGSPERFDAFLYEGTTLRATCFSNIATSDHPSYTHHQYTLSEAEANSISNYADLRIWVGVAALVAGETLRCSQCELGVPDASVEVTFAGTVTATSGAIGSLDSQPELIGTTDITSGAAGILSVATKLIGSIVTTSGAAGILNILWVLQSSTAITSGTSSSLNVATELKGSSATTSGIDSSLKISNSLISSSTTTFGTDSSLSIVIKLVGSIDEASGTDGSLTIVTIGIVTLEGFINIISDADGSFNSQLKLISSVDEACSTDGSFNILIGLISSTDEASGVDGSLDLQTGLGSSITEISGTDGSLNILWISQGSTDGISGVDGAITIPSIGVFIELVSSADIISGADGSFNLQTGLGSSIVEIFGISATLASFEISTNLFGSIGEISDINGSLNVHMLGIYERSANNITTYFQDIANRNFLIVRYDNDPRATPVSGLWCNCNLDFDSSDQKQIGINSYRHKGVFTMEFYNSIGIGQSSILRIIDTFISQFIQETVSDEVKFQTPKVKNIGRINDNYQINVICPFYVDN